MIGGTTGESSTLEPCDLDYLLKLAKNLLPNKTIIAATGSNCTKKALELQKIAQKAQADALLSIVPYYNKPTQKGLFAHFSFLAQNTDLPMIIYNNPARTIIDIEINTLKNLLSQHKNIVGLKESNTNMQRVDDIYSMLKEHDYKLSIMGGDDECFAQFMQHNAAGMISTISNLCLFEMQTAYKAFEQNEYDYACKIAHKLEAFSRLIFSYSNPLVLKTILAHMNLIKPYFRLPLCPLEQNEQDKIINEFNKFDWLKINKR